MNEAAVTAGGLERDRGSGGCGAKECTCGNDACGESEGCCGSAGGKDVACCSDVSAVGGVRVDASCVCACVSAGAREEASSAASKLIGVTLNSPRPETGRVGVDSEGEEAGMRAGVTEWGRLGGK